MEKSYYRAEVKFFDDNSNEFGCAAEASRSSILIRLGNYLYLIYNKPSTQIAEQLLNDKQVQRWMEDYRTLKIDKDV